MINRTGLRSVVARALALILIASTAPTLASSFDENVDQRAVDASVSAPQSESLPCQRVPSNVRGDARLIRLFMSFVAQSPTMRRQCAAIADAPHVRVVLKYAPSRPTFSRALSTIKRYEAGFVRVAIEIPVSTDVAELLAHELEHAMEAIEGLDLPSQAKVGGSGVTELVKGIYETARATRIGRLAADEITSKVIVRADVVPVVTRNAGLSPGDREQHLLVP
jgi:hypothetical protein